MERFALKRLIILVLIPFATAFHIDIKKPKISIPKPHIEIPKPHIEIPKPNIDLPNPKKIIEDLCDDLGNQDKCLSNIPHPLCLDQFLTVPGCFQSISKIIHKKESNITSACCLALANVSTNLCFNLIFFAVPNGINLIITEACNQVEKQKERNRQNREEKKQPVPPVQEEVTVLPSGAVVPAPPLPVQPSVPAQP
ncbi:hypothetical protein M5689_011562 [Euphorbia peplus]|nr:hypothetical protein M5689_011562 [Euphorbia peplus]